MPINLQKERLVSLGQAARSLPPRNSGKSVHPSCVYRWAAQGIRGVRLETILVGGRKLTSVEALQRFSDELTRSLESQGYPHLGAGGQLGSTASAGRGDGSDHNETSP